jgi:hypothetical protein
VETNSPPEAIKDVGKINFPSFYRHGGALLKVSAKAGHFTKAMKNGGEVSHVIFERCNKKHRIIRMVGCS